MPGGGRSSNSSCASSASGGRPLTVRKYSGLASKKRCSAGTSAAPSSKARRVGPMENKLGRFMHPSSASSVPTAQVGGLHRRIVAQLRGRSMQGDLAVLQHIAVIGHGQRGGGE